MQTSSASRRTPGGDPLAAGNPLPTPPAPTPPARSAKRSRRVAPTAAPSAAVTSRAPQLFPAFPAFPDPSAVARTPQMRSMQALPVVVAAVPSVSLVLVGCGGTGSHLAPTLVHLARLLQRSHQQVSLLFVDPDVVEEKNTLRQNFGRSEVGQNKAHTLARRYAGAFGLEIAAADQPISRSLLESTDVLGADRLTLLFGCVDNPVGRRVLAELIAQQPSFREAPRRWWIDCGNTDNAGQVLVGNCSDSERILAPAHLNAPALGGAITLVPSPSVQAPTLLQEASDIRADAARLAGADLACEDMELLNVQSLMINKEMATVAGRTALALVTGALKWMGVYDQPVSGLRTVVYTTTEDLRACASPGI